MKLVMSEESLKPEEVVTLAGIDVVVAVGVAEAIGIALTPDIVAMPDPHSNSSLCVLLAAILGKNIYLLVDEETHVSVHVV